MFERSLYGVCLTRSRAEVPLSCCKNNPSPHSVIKTVLPRVSDMCRMCSGRVVRSTGQSPIAATRAKEDFDRLAFHCFWKLSCSNTTPKAKHPCMNAPKWPRYAIHRLFELRAQAPLINNDFTHLPPFLRWANVESPPECESQRGAAPMHACCYANTMKQQAMSTPLHEPACCLGWIGVELTLSVITAMSETEHDTIH